MDHWLSSRKMTFWVQTEDDVIIDTAPIGRRFIGQPLSSLVSWMRHQGGFRQAVLDPVKETIMHPTPEQQVKRVERAKADLDHMLRTYVHDDIFGSMARAQSHRMAETPASTTTSQNGAYPGGLLVHTVETMKIAVMLATDYWQIYKPHFDDLPSLQKSAVKCGFIADMGKLGEPTVPLFDAQQSDWKIERGEMYEAKYDRMTSLPISMRSLFYCLQSHVNLTTDEIQAIVACSGGHVAMTNLEPLAVLMVTADLWAMRVRDR